MELLVVVLIIGILAAIAVPIYLGQQAVARGSSVEAHVTNAKAALIAYMTQEDFEPSSTPHSIDAIPGFNESSDMRIGIGWVDIDQPALGFCIAGDYGTTFPESTRFISNSGAAELGAELADCTEDAAAAALADY